MQHSRGRTSKKNIYRFFRGRTSHTVNDLSLYLIGTRISGGNSKKYTRK